MGNQRDSLRGSPEVGEGAGTCKLLGLKKENTKPTTPGGGPGEQTACTWEAWGQSVHPNPRAGLAQVGWFSRLSDVSRVKGRVGGSPRVTMRNLPPREGCGLGDLGGEGVGTGTPHT